MTLFKPVQDRSPLSIFHIINENWLHFELIDTFMVGNLYPEFWEDNKTKCSEKF